MNKTVIGRRTNFLRKSTNRLAYLLLHFNKKNVQVFLYCVLGATLLWFFNALNKEQTETIRYPIQFDYDQKEFIALTPLPNYILLNVKGNGWQILKKKLHIKQKPIVYRIKSSQSGNTSPSFILGPQLKRNVVDVLTDVRLEDILTDTINLAIDRIHNRIVNLKLDSARVKLPPNYRIVSPVQISPRQVALTGPKNLVSQIPDPFYIRLPGQTIQKNYTQSIPLDLRIKHGGELVKKDENEVKIRFQIDEFLPKNLQVSIEWANLPSDSTRVMPTLARKASLSCLVAKSRMGQVGAKDFQLLADFSNLNPLDSTIPLQIAKKPGIIPHRDIKFTKRVSFRNAP